MVKRKKEKKIRKSKPSKNDNPYSRSRKVRTGIKNFDQLIEGGFVKNSTNLLVGRSGAGKSIFALEFLVEGIKSGEKCLFLSFEEKKGEFYGHMNALGFDMEAYEKQGKFFFLEYTPQKVKTMLDEGGGAIESLVLKEKITRIVIDSISSLMLLFDKELDKKEAAFSLSILMKGWACTSLLTYEENLSLHKDSSRILDLEMDSMVLFYFLREKNRRNRFLEIVKMRGTNHSLSLHPFKIEKNGIVVNKTTTKK